MKMKTKRGIASIFIVISIIVGAIAFWITFSQGVSKNTTMVLIYLSAVLTGAFGSILLFTTALDNHVLPMIEELVEDARDDSEDLKKGVITFVHVSGFLLSFLTISFVYLTTVFNKLSSTWGPIPVLIPTLIILCVATWYLAKSRWFMSKTGRTPPIIFAILLIGMILALSLGITRTENVNMAIDSPVGEYDYNYRVEQAMSLATDTGVNTIDFSFGILSECDDDACFWIVVIILVVIATVILVIGSAYITHFWFFSGAIFLCGMWIIFVRELRVRPRY
jgi:hypothetical protein